MAISTVGVLLPVEIFDINDDRSSATFPVDRGSCGLDGRTAWEDTARLGVCGPPATLCVEEKFVRGGIVEEDEAEDEVEVKEDG